MHSNPINAPPHALRQLEAHAQAGTIPAGLLHPLLLTLWLALGTSAPWPHREDPLFLEALQAAQRVEEPLLAWLSRLEEPPPVPANREEEREQSRWDLARDNQRLEE